MDERARRSFPAVAALAAPALDAVLGGGDRSPALTAVMGVPALRAVAAVIVTLLVSGLALLGPSKAVGIGLLGVGVFALVVLVVAVTLLYWGLGALRRLIRKATSKAVFPPPPG